MPAKIDIALVTQSVIAILLTAALCFMWIAQIPLSDLAIAMMTAVVAFYFGTRTGASMLRQSIEAVNVRP